MSSIHKGLGAGAPEAPPEMPSTKQLKPDDFIKLFLAQLKNQNPMSPTDSSTILQQMAQISSISANNDMQKTLNNLQDHIDATLANSQVLAATQLIGKKVFIPSDKTPLDAKGLMGSVMMTSPSSDVKVTIKNEKGEIVNTIQLGKAVTPGLMDFSWDGKDKDGNLLKPGLYDISATADVKGELKPMYTAGCFEVKSVATNPKDGKVVFNVQDLGGKMMNEILKIL